MADSVYGKILVSRSMHRTLFGTFGKWGVTMMVGVIAFEAGFGRSFDEAFRWRNKGKLWEDLQPIVKERIGETD